MSFAPRPRYLALFLLAVLFQQAPALAGNCVGIAANQLPPGTLGADGLPLISYYDATNGDLWAAHCADTFCVRYFRRR